MYTLRKAIAAHTKVVKITQAKREWVEMSDRFRLIRSKMRNPMDTCFWCGHKFDNGDKMGIALMDKGPNKVICNDCFDKLEDA